MSASLKEESIKNYLSTIDFRKDNWSYKKIQEDMKKFLGETPAVDVSYKKDVMVNEVSGESKEFDKLVRVTVVYTDTDDKIKKLEIRLD